MKSPSRFALALSLVIGGALATSCGGGGGSPAADGLVTIHTLSLPGGLTGDTYAAQFAADFPHPPGRTRSSQGCRSG